MIVKDFINIPDRWLLDGLGPVVRMMVQVEGLPEEEDVTVDFSQTQFTTPVFVLSLIVYLAGCGRTVQFANVPEYLQTVGLPSGGLKPDRMRKTEFLARLESFSSKTYIPIVDFSALVHDDEKDAISSFVENMIIRQLSIRPNVANGMKYMIEETLDNITEHSQSERGYIFAQAFPKKGYLDVCIADCGVTLLGSYRKLYDIEIETDMEAIKAANRGISSKNLPDAENRGYGIRTSKGMLVDGLGGQYLMISGGALYFKRPGYDSFYRMPDGLRWNGTVVAMRIPYDYDSFQFNYIHYIE